MGFIAAAIIGSAAIGGGAAYMSSRNARKAQNSQNATNLQLSEMANKMEMERYFQSRGAAMGATYEELTAKPNDPNYNPNLSMFNPDGTAKNSAVLPLYLSQMESDMADDYQETYGALSDSYDGMSEYDRVQGFRRGLSGAEQGMIDTVNNVYDGTEMAQGQQYLDTILATKLAGVDDVEAASRQGLQNLSDARFTGAQAMGDARITGAGLSADARLRGLSEVQNERLSMSEAEAQAILNEGQRNAARANFTGRSGVVGNSGNAQANTLAALMRAYSNAGVNAATNRVLNAQDAAKVYLDNAQDYGTAYLDNATDANKVFLNNATDLAKITTTSAIDRTNALNQGAASDYALYEQNLRNRKDFGKSTGALNTIATNATAGLGSVYADQDATNNSLKRAGMQIGVGRMPEANIPSYTAPIASNPFEYAAAGIQSGLAGYQLANAFSEAGGGGGGAWYDPVSTTNNIAPRGVG